jgi:hypothetical protein
LEEQRRRNGAPEKRTALNTLPQAANAFRRFGREAARKNF